MTVEMERPVNSTSGAAEQPKIRPARRSGGGSRSQAVVRGLLAGGFLAGLASAAAVGTARAQSAAVPPTTPPSAPVPAWDAEKSDDGIEISSRPRAGSPYREVRGTMVVDAPPEAFLPLFRDADGYRSWLAECKNSSAVGTKQGPNDFHLYAVIGIPWPFEDRDTVVKAKIRRLPGGKGVVAFLRSMNDELVPARRGLVRMKSLDGQLLAEDAGGGKSRVEFRIFLEPAGSLSPVFVNGTAASIQLKTLRNVRERIAKLGRASGGVDAPEIGLTDPSLAP